MNTVYILKNINKEVPCESITENISQSVLVFDINKNFIGIDTYNLKLKKWMISRGTAKYWMKKVAIPSRKEVGVMACQRYPISNIRALGYIKGADAIIALLTNKS